jgi:alpha-galactosidase
MPSTVVAVELSEKLAAGGFPDAQSWALAPAAHFSCDWRGENADPARKTEVCVLWTSESLYLRFVCCYRTLTVFTESDADGRRYQLWERDVAEVFLQTDASQPRRYWEFEISPNGMWIDLEISPQGKRDPASGMKSRVVVDESSKIWVAEIALVMRALTPAFDPSREWRVNFFRVEGAAEPRFYSSWRPTYAPQPNFHVPEAFGILRFQKTSR